MESEGPPPLTSIPALPVRRQSSRGPMPFILLGCGGALVLAVLVGAVVFALISKGRSSVDPIVDTYLSQMNDGDYAGIYAAAHPIFREKTGEAQFVLFAERVLGALGKSQSTSFRGINVNVDNGMTTTTATYKGTFEKGEASLVFTIVDSKLAGVNYDSPLLESMLICPHCGAELQQVSRFCPSCGESLDDGIASTTAGQ